MKSEKQLITDSFNYHTSSISQVKTKPWLKTAIISHIKYDSDCKHINRALISKTVNELMELKPECLMNN